MRQHARLLGIVLVVILLVSGVQAAGGVALEWLVFGGGGGTSGSSRYRLHSTIGQASTEPSTGGPFSVLAGFWGPTGPAVPDEDVLLFLPVLRR